MLFLLFAFFSPGYLSIYTKIVVVIGNNSRIPLSLHKKDILRSPFRTIALLGSFTRLDVVNNMTQRLEGVISGHLFMHSVNWS